MTEAGQLDFQVGDISIHRIVELEAPFMDPFEMLPGLTQEVFDEHADWLRSDSLDENGQFRLCYQSYIVKTPHNVILVDSCLGNHKERARPEWHMLSSDVYMRGLARIGLTVDDIDYVMCTHLHVDHVGWNTRLLDGRWIPTFPNARYVFDRQEYALREAEAPEAPSPFFVDSVLPVMEAGQADLVDSQFQIGDHLRIAPTPGHTPHHFAVELGRRDTQAVITGDMLHVALQLRYPELSFVRDADPDLAAKTRRNFLQQHCDSDVLCCTAHLVNRGVGYIRSWDDGFRLSGT